MNLPDEQRERLRDLLQTWEIATEILLGLGIPQHGLSQLLESAAAFPPLLWHTDEHRRSFATALATGELAAMIFQASFVKHARTTWIKRNTPELAHLLAALEHPDDPAAGDT